MKKLIKFERPDDTIAVGDEIESAIEIETEDVVTMPREEYDDLQRKANLLDSCATLLETRSHTNEYAMADLIRAVYGIEKEDD